MNKETQDFIQEFETVIQDCERFCYPVRAKEYQKDAISKLEKLKQKIIEMKSRSISLKDEESANCCLSLEYIASAIQHELQMWIALKDDDSNLAWEEFVGAENAAGNSILAHQIGSYMQEYQKKLEVLEVILFPTLQFMSVGMIIRESRCSICGREYGECDHVKGRPYMGKLCSREITKGDLQEVSIVPHPGNKRARITSISDDDGNMRDLLSWRIISDEETK